MSAATYNNNRIKARRARLMDAMARPELTDPPDRFARRAPDGPTSAPVKVLDETTRALIEAALAQRNHHA